MKIIVPATSANIGPGFDSVGVAVSKYLIIEVLGKSDQWIIEHDLGRRIPSNERNLLIKVARRIAPAIRPHHLKMTTDIPLARGLGSSSSVIVAGIELANQLANLQLSNTEKLNLATKIEGHPDNVAPAIYGNLTISSYVNGEVSTVVTKFPEVSLIAYIPNYELRTKDSRGVLPKELSYQEAVAASSIANVAIAALMKGDMVAAGQAIESDRFHEHFRQGLIKEFPKIKMMAKENGVYATYLSGAGPTVMILVPKERSNTLKEKIEERQFKGQVFELQIDCQGVRVEK
ncbi:homoserine kinase [Streptococcus intermedius]|uniref:homoserine kinase n=1 Tax=Streptococcus intermedius TaxID=1338 RepID=UPI00025B70B2|nr:homoserine kinase [Streptococcus intermedius]EID83133.1 homoserine kinase [Streptococcus intermedius SK54 = ATCC 27335]EPH03895.1 homoserine kinase [Streptococcus intermedius SK54 = ATCC 27335]BAM23598.1 homoserine kinase [Streptococcus intermedius JTH08]SQH52054.1 homoserine kinase [Streptococcus intermedius]